MTIIDTTQITRQAKRIDPAKVLLTLLFVVPFLLGWIAGASVTASTWIYAAALVGWRTARQHEQATTPPSPSVSYTT